MFKTLTAGALAATLAFTGTTQTAQAADGDEIARFLFGAAALAIIAKGLENNNTRYVNRSYSHSQVITPHRGNRQHHGKARGRVVPKSCERTLKTRDGSRRVFGAQCVSRAGYTARLPQNCLREIRYQRKTVRAYGKQCLIEHGVRVKG